MRRNFTFFATVISLLLASTLVLTGCMHSIAEDNGEIKPYDLDRQNNNSFCLADGNITDETPPAQTTMQEKFDAMSDISEDGKSITVISEGFLDEYWHGIKARSLSIDEVFYIIQDSIRIYAQYDTVILSGFGSFAPDSRHAYIVPYIREDVVINTKLNETIYYEYQWDDVDAIYEIIMYRLKALSSPKAFFTGEEAISFAETDLTKYNDKYPKYLIRRYLETVFYIPDYSENTDRDHILSVFGENDDFEDFDKSIDLFVMSDWLTSRIKFSSESNAIAEVYPTAEMKDQTYPYFSANIPELGNALIEYRRDGKIYVDGECLTEASCDAFYSSDITGDGKPELCFVMDVGSGMIDRRILIYDYETRECIFSLSDRSRHDYTLFERNGVLCVTESKYMSDSITRTGVLAYDGSKIFVSWDNEQAKMSKYLTEENGVYKLTLPKSKKVLEFNDDQMRFAPYITDALVEAAEDKITKDVSEFSRHSDFYLQINEGYLCLMAEVIKDITPPEPPESGDAYIAGGCGIDHEHIFFSQRISSRPYPYTGDNPQ